MEFVTACKSLDCQDLPPLRSERECQAGQHSPALNQNGAGAALAVIATFLASGETKMLAQGI
jgi:hypothetical protein